MNGRFEVGSAYVANPAIRGAKDCVYVCTGRIGQVVTFARVSEMYRITVNEFEGREMARFPAQNGLFYFMASSVPVDASDADYVRHIMS